MNLSGTESNNNHKSIDNTETDNAEPQVTVEPTPTQTVIIPEYFDAFSDVSVVFEGIDSEGTAAVHHIPNGLSYNLDRDQGLKNGDIVTLRIQSLFEPTGFKIYAQTYGKMPEQISREYTVNGLAYYARTMSDISETVLQEMSEVGIQEKMKKVNEVWEKEYKALIERQKVSPAALPEFDRLSKAASERYDEAAREYNEVLTANDKNKANIYELQMFVDHLKNVSGVVEKFDYDLMRQTVKQMRVFQDKTVTVEFFSGHEISIII